MPRATVSVDLPSSAWIDTVSRSFPAADFRVVTVLAGEDTGIALVHVRAENPMPVLAAIQGADDVVTAELFWAEGDQALVQVEANAPPLLVPLWRAGVPVELPFDAAAGRATWSVTTSQKRLTAFRRALDDAGVEYDVEFVQGVTDAPADRVLTPRQREVLETAQSLGYYETPRDVTLTDVAAALDISKSNCSELLHRAEGHVIDWFLVESDGTETESSIDRAGGLTD